MPEGKFSDIELLYIKEVLDQHGEHLCDLLQEQIDDKSLIKVGDLQQSVNYRTGMYGLNPHLEISFLSYGRAIEIAYHKKSKNTRMFQKPNANTIVWGIREKNKTTKKKNTNWYSRTAYGSLNRLIAILMYEMSEKEVARLKGILEYQKTIQS